MEERTSGIILRTRLLTETSLIVQWLTPELGRIATVAKGARRAKSPFAGKLDLYYESDFSFIRSRRSELHTLKEVVLKGTHSKLRENLQWINQAAYFGVLIEYGTETETPLPEIYELFRSALFALPNTRSDSTLTLAFELKLLTLLGFEPDLERARLAAGTRSMAQAILGSSWQGVANLKLSGTQMQELNGFLRMSVASALERVPPQREKAV